MTKDLMKADPELGVIKPPPLGQPKKKLTTGRSLELAQHRQVAENAPPWKYVDSNELQAHRQYAPRWKWLYDALDALPLGKVGIQIECPKNIEIGRFRNMAGTAIRQAKKYDRWSIRKSIDGEHIVISKVGTWKEFDEKQNAKAAEG